MTKHEMIIGNSNDMKAIPNESVNLIITSPPYPMIEMWDELFIRQDSEIEIDLKTGNGNAAFNRMHELLNPIWKECDRVLANNGFVCINIGDATRTINNNFQLYSNHTQIINQFLSMGYSVLPDILWRKQSNAPNKFMGSGMYPAGAYVTYEHEYILIFRKGTKRVFNSEEKKLRQKSAFFWEERNIWFSDLWEIKGTSQEITTSRTSRERSAAYPLEIPYRLVNMYSAEGDTILDPFSGLGTTMLACMASKRNSIGIEIDEGIANLAMDNIRNSILSLNKVIDKRIEAHKSFIAGLSEEKKANCYENKIQGYKVKTKQETAIQIDHISSFTVDGYYISCLY